MPRFSVVIPAYNEERYLPRLLDSLDAAIAAYPRGSDAIQIVVADNASTDLTATIARERGCVVAPVEKRCIAASRNGGARASSGEILCFVDADSAVHRDTFAAIDEALARPGVVVGATGLVPERMSFGIWVTLIVGSAMVRLMGVDGGVVFCRRGDFDRVGGYDESLLFAEDIRFLLDLKRLGRFHRTGGARTTMSTRKWDSRGDWHFLLDAPRLGWMMLTAKARAEKYARGYWYDDRR